MPRFEVVRVRRVDSVSPDWFYAVLDRELERVALMGRGSSGRQAAHFALDDFLVRPARSEWYMWKPVARYR